MAKGIRFNGARQEFERRYISHPLGHSDGRSGGHQDA